MLINACIQTDIIFDRYVSYDVEINGMNAYYNQRKLSEGHSVTQWLAADQCCG